MDQIKIGKFIAKMRKEKDMTQRELADALMISDKTVSKWECGKGLPEVSLMMPLCATLGITVNDLLTGERVSDLDYKEKAEENMMNLMEENQRNKKIWATAIICGIVTIIAICSIVVIAQCISIYEAITTIEQIAIIVTMPQMIAVAQIFLFL